MGRLKVFLALGLCVALMMLPLVGLAGNPLPTGKDADGHPWDDGDSSSEPNDPADTLDDIDAEYSSGEEELLNSDKSATVHFLTIGKWYLLLIW